MSIPAICPAALAIGRTHIASGAARHSLSVTATASAAITSPPRARARVAELHSPAASALDSTAKSPHIHFCRTSAAPTSPSSVDSLKSATQLECHPEEDFSPTKDPQSVNCWRARAALFNDDPHFGDAAITNHQSQL